MDALAFYGLEPVGPTPPDDDRPALTRWRFPVVRALCSSLGSLFGGCGLGAALAALEHDTGRPVVWATAQFLQFAKPGSVVELEVHEVVRGHATSQARVLARVDDQEIFAVLVALGRRSLPWDHVWPVAPAVSPPGECPPRPMRPEHVGTIAERLDIHSASMREPEEYDGVPSDGRSSIWVRNPWGRDAQAAALAIVGDYVPMGLSQATGRWQEANSLDNTIRMVRVHETEWILADIRAHALADGFGHGIVHLWAEDGTLLATASQSCIVKQPRRQDGRGAGTAEIEHRDPEDRDPEHRQHDDQED